MSAEHTTSAEATDPPPTTSSRSGVLLTRRHAGGAEAFAERFPTGLLAAGGLIGGFGVAVASGSRPLGGVVLLGAGAGCGAIWLARHRPAPALGLGATMLLAFALSHVLAEVTGAWPAVLIVSAITWLVCERGSDAPARRRSGTLR